MRSKSWTGEGESNPRHKLEGCQGLLISLNIRIWHVFGSQNLRISGGDLWRMMHHEAGAAQ